MALTNALTVGPGPLTTLIAAATATGTGASQWFATQNSQTVDVVVDGAFSVCTVDHERSSDGGTTWVAVTGETGIDLAANKSFSFYCPVGIVHRLNVKTFTGTSVTVKGGSSS